MSFQDVSMSAGFAVCCSEGQRNGMKTTAGSSSSRSSSRSSPNSILVSSSLQNSNRSDSDDREKEMNSLTSLSSPVPSRSMYTLSSHSVFSHPFAALTPNRTVTSTSKSWMSPFSNWMSRTPESQSKYSMADLSPHSIFSSPWINQSDLPSPPPTKGKELYGSSIFSPSFFSPFNKSMNPLKFNVDSDDQDSLFLMSEPFDSEL
jgi:hypothetical protein